MDRDLGVPQRPILGRFYLTLNVPCISESCIEREIKLNFYFTLLCGASKDFTKAFNLIFSLHPGLGREVLIYI